MVGRLLSAKLAETFNNPFIVEDVPGVGGVIAANETAQAPPDGIRYRSTTLALSRSMSR